MQTHSQQLLVKHLDSCKPGDVSLIIPLPALDAGSDYTTFDSDIGPFNDGNRRICFDIEILEDIAIENDEMFRVFLALSSGNGVTVEPSAATVTITDVDRT